MDWSLSGVTRDFKAIFGRAVTKSTYTPTYNVDDACPLVFDQATGRLMVDSNGSGGGGGADTQYASGATVATPTGTVAMGKYNSTPPTIPSGNVQELQLDSAGNLKVNNRYLTSTDQVTTLASQGTLSDGSGTIAAGGTAQTVFSSNSSRKYLAVQNLSATNLYLNFTSNASTAPGSYQLSPGQLYEFPSSFISTEAVSIYGATTGQGFTAKQA